jgi:hypothetical protein
MVGVRRGLFPASSRYVERVWLPVLGPTPVLALRLLAELAERSPSGTATIDSEMLAVSLGLGPGTGAGSSLARALRRLERFGIIRRQPTGELLIRTELPPVNDRDLSRLPSWLRAASHAIIRSASPPSGRSRPTRECRVTLRPSYSGGTRVGTRQSARPRAAMPCRRRKGEVCEATRRRHDHKKPDNGDDDGQPDADE